MVITKNKIENFIKTYELPEVAEGILLTNEDCDLFLQEFYSKNHYVIDDLLDFKEYKISSSEITVIEFLNMCNNGEMHMAFETTFLQKFSPEDMSFIEEKIKSRATNLKEIYVKARKNPFRNVLKIVL
jgi:hypothetical protein